VPGRRETFYGLLACIRNRGKISRMLRLWADRFWSICAGAGLVLLMAAEGGLCSHLLPGPKNCDSVADSSGDAASGSAVPAVPACEPANDQRGDLAEDPASGPPDPAQSEPQTPAWTAPWPDAVPARRPWHLDWAVQAESAGPRAGAIACGPLNAGPVPQSAWGEVLPPWRADRYLPPVLAAVPPDFQARPVLDPALVTVLKRTGPPC